jgi:uncharacterized Tic20 family protein
MKKILLFVFLFCFGNTVCHATFYRPVVIPIVTEVSSTVLLAPEKVASNTTQNSKPTVGNQVKKLMKKLLPDYTIGDGYDIFSVISFISLLLSFFSVIAAIVLGLGASGATISGSFIAFLLIAALLGLLSFVTTIIAGVRIKKNKDLKGKGFFYASGIYWGLNILYYLLQIMFLLLFRP